jgi:hypothetical protein
MLTTLPRLPGAMTTAACGCNHVAGVPEFFADWLINAQQSLHQTTDTCLAVSHQKDHGESRCIISSRHGKRRRLVVRADEGKPRATFSSSVYNCEASRAVPKYARANVASY